VGDEAGHDLGRGEALDPVDPGGEALAVGRDAVGVEVGEGVEALGLLVGQRRVRVGPAQPSPRPEILVLLAAVVGDRGIVFLFNPNPGSREARFKLDGTIGLTEGEKIMIKELYPEEGRLVGSPEGLWAYGGEVALTLPGREAAVYEIFPAPAEITEPVLFNVRGAAELRSTRCVLTGVTSETGASRPILVLLPADARVRALSVNGVAHPFKAGQGLITATVRFAGRAFGRSQAAGKVPAGFTGGIYKARTTVPARVFTQLAERKKSWPVAYTEDDLRAPWLGPWRLLLHIPIIEGTEAMDVTLKINGVPVDVLKA
jgi:hypothetical protein